MLTTVFLIAWNALVFGMFVRDIRQPSMIGPFNETTIHAGCHWRVEWGTASDGMPYSRVWPDVLCFERTTMLTLTP